MLHDGYHPRGFILGAPAGRLAPLLLVPGLKGQLLVWQPAQMAPVITIEIFPVPLVAL